MYIDLFVSSQTEPLKSAQLFPERGSTGVVFNCHLSSSDVLVSYMHREPCMKLAKSPQRCASYPRENRDGQLEDARPMEETLRVLYGYVQYRK